MDILGRYYTADVFSELLVDQFTISNPTNVVDLGVGGGSLIKAAITKWINASYFAVDLDRKSINNIKNELPFVKSFHLDTIKVEVADKLKIKKGTVDIAICNPPFLKVKNVSSYDSLFEDAKLNECKDLKLVTSEIIFLAKNLQLLKSQGELGIILPDSLVTGKEFSHFRDSILLRHSIKGIIQLPDGIYPKTQALTHILLIEKSGITKRQIPLFLANRKGEIENKIEVEKGLLGQRMDFKYHLWNKTRLPKRKTKKLGMLEVEIKRGTLTHIDLKKTKECFIHTTEIINQKENQLAKNYKKKNSRYLLTRSGDILLGRVGRNIKVCMISKGKAPLSDCIYRIRVASSYRMNVWNSLISAEGQQWLKANSHGVCAKVISKKDLLKFPIQF